MEKDISKRMRELEQRILETGFFGVVSIFRNTTNVFNKAFGYRDIKNELPNTIDTIFGIASGTKIFTALGIGRLIDQGVISLETTVGEIDSTYTGFIDARATIKHLLTHTSGIYDYYDEEIEQASDNFFVEIPWNELETPSDYYPLFKKKKMKFSAGERFSYSNGGYVFLGILIEKLSDKLYRDYIGEQLLVPVGMQSSGFFAFNDLPRNTANGYFGDRKTINIYNLPIRGGGDGGMYTTVEDMRLFWEKLLSNGILSEELTKIYLETHITFNDTDGYGCGIYTQLDGSRFSISGSDAGVFFSSYHFVRDKLTVTIVSNVTGDGVGSTVRGTVLNHLHEMIHAQQIVRSDQAH